MSQTVELALNSIPYQNIDSITLDNFSDSLFDGYIDEAGNTVKRPGINFFLKLSTGKKWDGAFWWESKSMLICVSDGNVYKIVDETGTKINITGDKLEDNGRVTFAENGSYLVMANGGKMVYTDGTANTAYIADPDAPTKVTHVAYIDFYLIAFQVGTSKVQFANFQTTPTTWLAADFFTAEANPDGLKALYVNRRTIYLFGTSTIEFWVNDGISPFARINGQTAQRGITAPYTTVSVNDILYFFDSKRRLTGLSTFTPQIINTSFDKLIQSFDTFDDVLADYTTVDGRNFLIFSFPTEDRTFVYDLDGPGTAYWTEWSTWKDLTEVRQRFILNSYAYSPLWNLHFIGSAFDDSVYLFDKDFYTDNGTEIHFAKRTGWLDHGAPDKLKRSYRIKSRMKSGIGIGDQNQDSATARIRWREDGDTQWGNWVDLDLGKQGERNFLKSFNSNGAYYTRQYEITMTDNVPFVMGEATERLDLSEF